MFLTVKSSGPLAGSAFACGRTVPTTRAEAAMSSTRERRRKTITGVSPYERCSSDKKKRLHIAPVPEVLFPGLLYALCDGDLPQRRIHGGDDLGRVRIVAGVEAGDNAPVPTNEELGETIRDRTRQFRVRFLARQ